MKKITHTLGFQLKKLVFDSGFKSFKGRYDKIKMLELATRTLKEGGFKNMTPESLKPKHIDYLIGQWKANGTSTATIKNRMSAIRWWAGKVGKPNMIPRSNKELGIEDRKRIPTVSKAKELSSGMLSRVDNRYVEASLKLQEAFGLRLEESIMFSPNYAIRGNMIVLKDTWCKGKRERVIGIRTEKQRAALAFAKSVAGGGALIPPNKNRIQQVNVFKAVVEKAGICNVHGFRHFYAQGRYKELTKMDAPILGGVKRAEMSPEQKRNDDAVRLLISQDLGHNRVDIVASYLGK